MAEQILHLSAVVRSPLVDPAGERLGRVEDLIVRLADGGYPPVIGVKARIGGRDLFVPADRLAALEPASVRLAGEKLDLGRFERRPGEVLLRQDILGRKLIHVEAARLVTAHDMGLMSVDGWWRVVGIEPGWRARLRRILPRPLAGRIADRPLLDWTELEPFVDHVPSARLRLPHRKLVRLHPAQIADLVEAASHEEGEEIIKAVGSDRELEADVFEELDQEHQLEFIRERSDQQAAAVLSRMAADDAADLIADLDQERREPVLSLLPAGQQRKIRALLGYNPSTAGGLMSPEFLSLAETATVADALAEVASSRIPREALSSVQIEDGSGALIGSTTVVELLRSPSHARLSEIVEGEAVSVPTDADVPEVARLMTDFNLTALPVVDAAEHVVGVVTVDDVLELILPAEWRRRYGLARD